MEAIILAGGFGTRLKHIVSDVPKPMAPVCEKPFLKYILDYLADNGINKIIMAVGYKKDAIIKHFGNSYREREIIYSSEDTPLFTGGAIKKALMNCNNDHVFIINGDTFFEVNLEKMQEFHYKNNSMLTIATKEMFNFERYGTVSTNNNRIIDFKEKRFMEHGYINGGIYYMNRNMLDDIHITKFSFETDVMAKKVREIPMFAYLCTGYFIDIGIAEDYFKAQKDFKTIKVKYE
jgi:D-glycero-alpha-D-manno-heptose 1-phosphate guanylyltransferase